MEALETQLEEKNLKDKYVLVFTSVYPTTIDGNHGAFIRETVLRLQGTGAEFAVFAPAYEGSKSYNLDGIKVHRFRYFFKIWENLVRDGAPTKIQKQPIYLIVAAFYILLGSWQLFWLCSKKKPDILHIHWPFPHGLMALPASKLLGIPMVFSFHGGELLLAKKFGFVANILRWLLPIAKGVTSNSSFTKGLISQLSSTVCTTIIPYGMTIEPKPSKKRQPGEIPRLLFVGRFDERKGLKYLLEALPLVLAKKSVRLRLVGEGILEAQIKSHCAKLGLDEVVDFLGFVTKEELAEEYASCEIFVLPAIIDSKGDTEGLGVVIIEALAHSKPVVATNVGGISDIITSDHNGIMVQEKEPIALAQAILHLLADSTKAAKLGDQGLIDVQEKFSWDRIIPLWNSILIKALL